MSKVLIFGINGFVGAYLAQEFLNNGYEVCGSDVQCSDNLPENIKFFQADLLSVQAVEEVIISEKPDIIVNLAAVSSVGLSWKIPQTTISVNVVGTLNILEAVRKYNPVSKVMLIGSSEEYENFSGPINEKVSVNSANPYGISKIAQESFASLYRERYGLSVYCVRAFNHTGIGQKDSFVLPSFCKQVAEITKSGKPGIIKVGNLEAERDFSDVRDIVRAYRMIVESSDCTKIFNVGSGKKYRLRDILNYVISLSNEKITVEIDPERFRPVDIPVSWCDYGYIKKELGWCPEYEIFDTLKEMFEDYLERL